MSFKKNRDARKPALRRLDLIERSEIAENVASVCRDAGVSRTQFYEFKKRFDREGVRGLIDHPLGPHSHPLRTSAKVEVRVVRCMIEHPDFGTLKIRRLLEEEGIILSRPTILNIAARHGMESREDRYLELELLAVLEEHDPGDKHLQDLESLSPCFRERADSARLPGQLIVHGFKNVGIIGSGRDFFIHAFVDTASCFVVADLAPSNKIMFSHLAFRDCLLPQYQTWGVQVRNIRTEDWDSFDLFSLTRAEDLFTQHDVNHERVTRGDGGGNGFLEWFFEVAEREFVQPLKEKAPNVSVPGREPEQARVAVMFQAWLSDFNTRREHRRFPNFGQTPVQCTGYLLDREGTLDYRPFLGEQDFEELKKRDYEKTMFDVRELYPIQKPRITRPGARPSAKQKAAARREREEKKRRRERIEKLRRERGPGWG